ncbi:MAG: hypothetical protein EBT07_13375 [Actinobacteria bacterium]|nr:hypothetical protein [Actinomycetota bacterium]
MTLSNAINKAKRMAVKHSKTFHVFKEEGEFFICDDIMSDNLWFGAIPVTTILEDGKEDLF